MEIPMNKPVYDGYLADPFAWRAAGKYYMIGTAAPDSPVIEGRCFPLLISDDFVAWHYAGHILDQPDPALGNTYWAPEVAERDGTYYLYYSVGIEDTRHQLRVATASQPDGPYLDNGVALTDLRATPFAIDPSPFRDKDGQWYLFYARDFLDEENGARPGTALAMDTLTSMTQLAGREQTVMRARHDWQRFQQNRAMYGSHYDWHTLEGPCVWLRDNRYTCFYSGGRWDSPQYGVDWAVSSSIVGPYQDTSGDSVEARITHTVPGRILGPGHNSVVVGPDGNTYIVYHAWNADRTVRSPYISRLDWNTAGEPLPVPFR